MEAEKFIALWRKREVEEVYNVKDRPADYIMTKTKAPLIEMASDCDIERRVFNIVASLTDEDELTFLHGLATSLFEKWGKFGYYGDVIQFTRHVVNLINGKFKIFTVDHIGHLAFPKGTLAVDLIPFFTDKSGKTFFVGITMAKGQFEGQPALIGGHVDLNGFHFESTGEAVAREGKEEATIILEPKLGEEDAFIATPIPEEMNVILKAGGMDTEGELKYVGPFWTSEQEEIPSSGVKRVDWTFAYILEAKFNIELSEKILRDLFKPRSDAKDLIVVELGRDTVPYFPYDHHRDIFRKALHIFKESDPDNCT